VDLPGPAAFWPDDYDFELFGFGIPPPEKAPLYLRAWEIATMVAEEPDDFPLLLPCNDELVMMELVGAAKHPKKFIIIN
jgi:hypothetical protein